MAGGGRVWGCWQVGRGRGGRMEQWLLSGGIRSSFAAALCSTFPPILARAPALSVVFQQLLNHNRALLVGQKSFL